MAERTEESKNHKSSKTAKAGLTLGIIGTSLASAIALGAANSGNGECCCDGNGGRNMLGGLLGNIFGTNNGGASCCCLKSLAQEQRVIDGERAITEVAIGRQIAPLAAAVCELQRETAVNRTISDKNEVITGLMFRLADQKSDNLFERAMCCCEKNTIGLQNAYNQLAAQAQCNYDRLAAADQCNYDRLSADQKCCCDRLDAKIDCVSNAATMRTDAEFALQRAQTDAQLAQAMCGVVKGKPYISPSQMADPYMGSQHLLTSRTVAPATYVRSGGCCEQDFYSWAW